MSELFDLFRVELETQVATLERALSKPAVSVEDLVHAAHSLKGAARIVGVALAERLGHALETRAVAHERGAPVTDAGRQVIRGTIEVFRRLSTVPDEASLAAWEIAERAAVETAVDALAMRGEVSLEIDPAMLEMFRLEVESQTATLNGGLVALEADPSQLDAVMAVMRAAHSIKGAARIIGIDAVVELAHAMEDLVVAIRDRGVRLDSETIDLLLAATDLLSDAATATRGDFASWLAGRGPQLVRTIENLGKAKQPAAGAPAQLEPVEKPELTKTGKIDTLERVVRVNVATVDRLVGLAGESLVEARRLPPLADSLHVLVRRQTALRDLLDELEHAPERRTELLELARNYAGEVRSALIERADQLEDHVRQSEDLAGRLYRETLASRMRPISDGLKGFTRLVRDLSRRLHKQVELVVIGGETGVDRDILEKIEGPLTHLVRNAMDHGIEAPAERRSTGKAERATVTIEARHRAGTLVIAVSDDGRGIDVERVRARAIQRGLLSAETQLTATAAMEYLMMPGFSTASEITEVSGRGVGLDVVQNVVQEVGGTLRISSELGKGTSFHMQLPLTRSVMRALAVEIAGDPYAFPLGRVERIVEVGRSEVTTVEGRPCFHLASQPIPLISAARILELGDHGAVGDRLTVVVIGDRVRMYGVIVDRLLGELDLVVRPLDRRLGKVADISATAIIADGRPLLIIDVEDMVRSATWLLSAGPTQLARIAAGATAVKHVLVVDDTITVREVERQLLEARGYRVSVAVDGMDGWQRVRGDDFDLVITDIDMPRLDGIDLVRSIRQDPRLGHLPVMIVSYRDREEDRRRGLEVGANRYVTKSDFADDKLVAAVIDLIGEP